MIRTNPSRLNSYISHFIDTFVQHRTEMRQVMHHNDPATRLHCGMNLVFGFCRWLDALIWW
ncbi:hypothetical protein DA391_07135 [Yersinia massiliensis]|uniref:Uncharacterized protein n=1 Tax=Yersinia massiliensis TaxID=419257 RepID=A0ABM6URS4_9GAMM|nr:hypothetical protein DA391_07135 [Yersinia massiliensis]